ncbi:hypothetical protein MRX96_008828 [Rhipicephalus microplus]
MQPAVRICVRRVARAIVNAGARNKWETLAVMQPAVRICVRRVARAIVNAGARNKWVHFTRTAEEKAVVKEEFLWFVPLPGMIGCIDSRFVVSKSEQKAPFWPR